MVKKILQSVFYLPLFFPLYLIKIELLGIPTNLVELMIFGMFALYILMAGVDLVRGGRGFGDFWQRNELWFWGCLVFALVVLPSVLVVPENVWIYDGGTLFESKKVALGIVKSWLVAPLLFFWMLVKGVEMKAGVEGRRGLSVLLNSYIVSALPLVVWAIYQNWANDFVTLDGRSSGPFVNANYLAMYLSPAVLALWIKLIRVLLTRFAFVKLLILAGAVLIYSLALLYTQSYGAILAVLLSMLVYLILNYRVLNYFGKMRELALLKKIIYFSLVLASIVVIAAGLVFAKTEKWQVLFETVERSSSSVRLQIYQISAELIAQNPVLGIGLGQYEAVYNLKAAEILGKAPYEWVMIHPHNILLAFWLNLGGLGLAVFLALVVKVFYKYVKADEFEDKYFKLVGVAMLLVILIHGQIDTHFFKNDLSLIFWMILALTLLPLKTTENKPNEEVSSGKISSRTLSEKNTI